MEAVLHRYFARWLRSTESQEADSEAVLDYFINEGILPHTRSKRGKTALMEAAEAGNLEAVKRLIWYAPRFGSKIDGKDPHGNTALIYAARNGHTQVVRVLIEAGAQVTISGKGGRSALFYAIKSGNGELMQLICGVAVEESLNKRPTFAKQPVSCRRRRQEGS